MPLTKLKFSKDEQPVDININTNFYRFRKHVLILFFLALNKTRGLNT